MFYILYAIRPYIIGFILINKAYPLGLPFLKGISRLLIKTRNSIGNRGTPYSIPVVTIIWGLS